MRQKQITRLFLSNFLAGLVFWYGIEKLFMINIGIDAVGVGIATALLAFFNLVFDIPAGILADKWSRKGVLVISSLSLATCSLILGFSSGLPMYLIGYLFYGLFVVTFSGTYQAIIYDILHEKGRKEEYSKVMGRAYALYLLGSAVANIFSGFLVSYFNFSLPFTITVIPCILNVVLILSIKEPKFHKDEKKERVLTQLRESVRSIYKIKLLRGLAVVMSVFAAVEMFKGEFGQLYIFRYISTPQVIGLLWSAYAVTWSIGSAIAHRLHNRLNILIILSISPLLLMSFIDNGFSLVLFMIQAVASAAMLNQIETKVQHNTPSAVRASTLSLLSAAGRGIVVPFSFLVGWITRDYDVIWSLRLVSLVALLAVLYWLVVNKNEKNTKVTKKYS